MIVDMYPYFVFLRQPINQRQLAGWRLGEQHPYAEIAHELELLAPTGLIRGVDDAIT